MLGEREWRGQKAEFGAREEVRGWAASSVGFAVPKAKCAGSKSHVQLSQDPVATARWVLGNGAGAQ